MNVSLNLSVVFRPKVVAPPSRRSQWANAKWSGEFSFLSFPSFRSIRLFRFRQQQKKNCFVSNREMIGGRCCSRNRLLRNMLHRQISAWLQVMLRQWHTGSICRRRQMNELDRRLQHYFYIKYIHDKSERTVDGGTLHADLPRKSLLR